MYLTQNSTPIIGQVAQILGWIMDAIFNFLDKVFHFPSIGLTIILFTIIVYMLMLPLQIKQQKFSKLNAKMQPEIAAIQKKYKNKKDNESMMKMNEETKAVYSKYGVSPTGSCLQLLIQMPILFALYRVIWNVPAYVSGVKDAFMPLVDKVADNAAAISFIEEFGKANGLGKLDFTLKNSIVDVMYKFKPDTWKAFGDSIQELNVGDLVNSTAEKVTNLNSFFGMNISDTPWNMFRQGIESGAVLIVIGAVAIPILAGVTQWLNTKLMPKTPTTNNEEPNAMESSMKTMNVMMPLMSSIFCITLPAGMGLYWIAGAVIRSVQQFSINKYLDKVDVDELMKKNLEKVNKKREKQGLPPQKTTNLAKMNVRNIENPKKKEVSKEDKEKAMKDSTEYYNKNAKPGSIASKANMVRQYNERNKK